MKKCKPAMNLAIKCNWNDANYEGICSDVAYEYNVNVRGAAWCSNCDSDCRAYAEDEISEECYPCVESQIFVTHQFHITGRPYQVKQSELGKLALLTTRLPETSESQRIVFGYLYIDDIYENDELLYPGTTIVGNIEKSFQFPKDVAVKMKFWNYYKNEGYGLPKWGSGLFRYVSDDAVDRFLNDLQAEIDKK